MDTTKIFIRIPFQEAYEFFCNKVAPWPIAFGNNAADEEEMMLWFDRWLGFLVGTELIEGDDIDYLYHYRYEAVWILHTAKVPFSVVDRHGDNV